MLESLYIENFAIIEKLNIDFTSGMTVLTGETGAGKSIIIDAIGQLSGNRTDVGFVRDDCDKAIIEGIFSSNHQEIVDFFDEAGIEFDNQIVISKTIYKTGRAVYKLNYRTTTQSLISALSRLMVEIHNQFDTQFLFNPRNHLGIIDKLDDSSEKYKLEYTSIYQEYVELHSKLNNLQSQEYSDEQLEFYEARLTKIDEIDIDNIDFDALLEEKSAIDNYAQIQDNFDAFKHYIQNSISSLNESLNYLAELNNYGDYSQEYDEIYNKLYEIEDHAGLVEQKITTVDVDEYRITEIQDILAKFNHLKKIYGPSQSQILAARAELAEKIAAFTNRDEQITSLESLIKEKEQVLEKLAEKISKTRKKASLKFEKDIKQQLKELYLVNVNFKVDFEKGPLTKTGFDRVEFLISTNIGMDLQPLAKVASGGEMSRVMLAIKVITLRDSTIETIIFDEADSGVSGKVAAAIGRKMASIAKSCQVITITHLFQVAAYSNQHLFIKKQVKSKKTQVVLQQLDFEGQVEELAKMISSENLSPESLDHARNLLLQAQEEIG